MLKIVNCDCLSGLKQQPNDSIDLIITSPPYNLHGRGGEYKILTYSDDLPEQEYQQIQVEVLNECYRVLKPTGLMFYNHKNRYLKSEMISPLQGIYQSKMSMRQEIIGNRLSTVDFNKNRFATLTERVYILQKDKDKSFRFKQPAVSYCDIGDIARPTPKENYGHDATFPVELIYRIINSIDTNGSDKIIVDIYGGTGTTAQAATPFGFKEVIMIEQDKQGNEVIKQKSITPFTKEALPTINMSRQEKIAYKQYLKQEQDKQINIFNYETK